MTLAHLIGVDGFDDVTHEEFNELIDSNSTALTDEDLAELTESAEEETEDQEDPSNEEEDVGLTLVRLAELMRTSKELQRSQLPITMLLTKVKKSNQATSKESATPPPEVSGEEELPELLQSSS